MKNVLFVASECAPFIKTGGLGQVVGSLPKELARLDTNVSVVIPAYECISLEYKERMEQVISFPVRLNWRSSYVDLKKIEMDHVSYYFIQNDNYFVGEQPYSDIWLDIEKYAFFCKAVLEMLAYLELSIDVIHCQDWQTGLLPVYLRTLYDGDPYFQRIQTIITIHNLRFQGITDIDRMKDITGLPDETFTYDKLEHNGNANMLKGGIAFADLITTVSKTYADEIRTAEYGEGLSSVLNYRKDDLYGIVNGIDWNTYNPEDDPCVRSPYNKNNFEERRGDNKTALQRMSGLKIDQRAFSMGIVARLTEQKGYDLIDGSIDDVLEEGAQLYVLGSGESWVEDIFERYRQKYPAQIFVEKNYSDSIAKAIYAGCDITLMPSRFEPCGLNQLMAMRYGCLPLVRATGGLKDTVSDDEEQSAKNCGFVFEKYDKEELKKCLIRAKKIYDTDDVAWKRRIRQAMNRDFSWRKSAKEYQKLYESSYISSIPLMSGSIVIE